MEVVFKIRDVKQITTINVILPDLELLSSKQLFFRIDDAYPDRLVKVRPYYRRWRQDRLFVYCSIIEVMEVTNEKATSPVN